ncbi:hypothetical protein [Psychromonas sp. MB-3u-54]|uniref:hypothetical protein n=1 Tax=Psychromonas sp. MB-3u-54 TaxID=2058319 RepID=UPI0012FEC645|nr:hypothetical protein [Psychromonas sp. MB-3u-54]
MSITTSLAFARLKAGFQFGVPLNSGIFVFLGTELLCEMCTGEGTQNLARS